MKFNLFVEVLTFYSLNCAHSWESNTDVLCVNQNLKEVGISDE